MENFKHKVYGLEPPVPIIQLQHFSTHDQSCFIYVYPHPFSSCWIILKQSTDIIYPYIVFDI